MRVVVALTHACRACRKCIQILLCLCYGKSAAFGSQEGLIDSRRLGGLGDLSFGFVGMALQLSLSAPYVVSPSGLRHIRVMIS